MRKVLYIASLLILFIMGWFSHLLIKGEDTPSYHWKKLDQLREHALNPDNHGTSMGFSYITPPFDDTPHLEALVASGDLNKRSVLIPGLPANRENTKDWVTFSNHPDVLQAMGQPDYADDEDSRSKEVLSFTIWYLPSFESNIKAYIDELKKRANKTLLPIHEQKIPHWWQAEALQGEAMQSVKLKPGDKVFMGTNIPADPFNGLYTIDKDGTVLPKYCKDRVGISGLSEVEASKTVLQHTFQQKVYAKSVKLLVVKAQRFSLFLKPKGD